MKLSVALLAALNAENPETDNIAVCGAELSDAAVDTCQVGTIA